MLHRIIKFTLLAYGITWLIWMPLWAPALGLDILPSLRYQHMAGGAGPCIAAWIMDAGQNSNGFRKLFKSKKTGLMIAALIAPFMIMGISITAAWLIDGSSPQWRMLFRTAEYPEFGPIAYFFVNLIFFGVGEEAGWRGYLLLQLEQCMRPAFAAVVVSVIWAGWHIPAFLYRPGYMSMGAGGIAGWMFSLLAGSCILTWLYRQSRGSIWACALFHAAMDVAFIGEGTGPLAVSLIGAMITLIGIAVFIKLLQRPVS